MLTGEFVQVHYSLELKDYCLEEAIISHEVNKCSLDMYGSDGSKNYIKLKTSVYTTLHV